MCVDSARGGEWARDIERLGMGNTTMKIVQRLRLDLGSRLSRINLSLCIRIRPVWIRFDHMMVMVCFIA